MALEDLYLELKEYGNRLEEENYFILLSMKLANAYYNYFNHDKIDELFSEGVFLESTKLDLNLFFQDEKELSYLKYPEKLMVNLGLNSYMIINLENQVEELWVKNRKINKNKMELQEILSTLKQLKLPINDSNFHQVLENIHLSSLIYQYAYLLIKAKINSQLDFARAGMFKNAYYHIIELKLPNYFPKTENEELQPINTQIRA